MAKPPADALDRLAELRGGGSTASLPDDAEGKQLYPTLWSFLTRRDAAGQFAKDPATISLRMGLGSWVVQLSDPTLEVSLQAVVPYLQSHLEALERAASDPSAAWVPWRRSEGRLRPLDKDRARRRGR